MSFSRREIMKKGILLSLFLMSSLQTSYSCTIDGKEGIVPENDLYISVHSRNARGISEEEFHSVLDKVEGLYKADITAKGKTLQVVRNWTDGTVNAYAEQSGATWKISMFGGLARHETITADGFALVACHELGHHLGGAPKKKGLFSLSAWASNEGQSDYWGTMKCLRKYFETDDNILITSTMDIPAEAKAKCESVYSNAEDLAVCHRSAMAGMSLARLFQVLRKLPEVPKFETPDPKVVWSTNHSHPDPQCRLDTYFQGALCDKDLSESVSDSDANKGVCSAKESYTLGLRPKCWFKPSIF
jgi:hypothetical protein